MQKESRGLGGGGLGPVGDWGSSDGGWSRERDIVGSNVGGRSDMGDVNQE